MCGICGLYHYDKRPVSSDILISMTSSLEHRGPDEDGYYLNTLKENRGSSWRHNSGAGNLGFGHRRLSIIDLRDGQQPMSSADDNLWIVFNGEIYNFETLRNQLIQKGYEFKTKSDTETILYAYEEWGKDCVKHLRGMFAFALWDKKRQRLFLGRDRLGIKPLYYFWNGFSFVFGSEIKALLASNEISKEINSEAILDYFSFLYIPGPKSIFSEIKKLQPGHTLTVEGGGVEVDKYWDVSFHPDSSISEKQWCEEIIEKLIDSINVRLVSEVPLGAFLSGGIDSSAVVALMSSLLQEPVKTSSIGFDDDRFNELPHAREIVNRYQTEHDEQIVTPDAVDALDKLTWHYDEPFADSSALPTYYVSKMTRKKVTVALSGDGGDENFAGYRRYYFDRLENQLRGIFPDTFRSAVVGPLSRIYPKADWLPQIFRAKTLLTNLSVSPLQGYYNSMSWFGSDKKAILAPDLRKHLESYNPEELFEQHGLAADTDDPLSRIQYIDMKTYLVDGILTKVDRASMANSLEVRVPLLDHEFVELIAKIPSNLKLRGREGKAILKQSLRPYVPDSILCRPKRGFSIPLKDWLRNELKPVFTQAVLEDSSGVSRYLDQNCIHKMWLDHQSGIRDYAAELWSLLFFAKWLQKFEL